MTLKHAEKFFPAYKFYVNEFLNDEWLAAVDWHKPFHRDHVIHQPYVAYVGMTLLNDKWNVFEFLNEIVIPDDKYIPAVLAQPGSRYPLTFLDLCVDAILEPGGCGYLLDYIKEMGAPEVYWKYEPDHKDKNGKYKGKAGLTRQLWKWMFLDTFFLAALFHDIGYPWKFVNVIHDKLDPHAPLENPAQQSAEQIASRYGDRLVFYPLNYYRKKDPSAPADWADRINDLVKRGLTKTHGMPGAISFLHLNDLLAKFPADAAAPARRFCVEWAAMAVMMHDMAGVYSDVGDKNGGLSAKVVNPQLRVSFLRDPMSFVLTLSDLIEEFARPDARFTKTGIDDDEVHVSYGSRCESVDVNCDDRGILTINYKYNSPADVAAKNAQFIPKETLQYFDPMEGYLDYRGSGITSVRMTAEKA